MKTSHQFALALLIFSAINLPHSIFAQGSLAPPGAPAPMFRTLEEVQPRRPIGTNATPAGTNSLFEITQPGSYYLTTNITGVAGKHGILIIASGVTLDLMGFELVGVSNSLDGINASLNPTLFDKTNVVVRNGTIRNWGSKGINALSVRNGQYHDLRLSDNLSKGLDCGQGAIVVNCSAWGNDYGISAFSGTLSGCAASFNRSAGFQIPNEGSSLIGCVAAHNEDGIVAGNDCAISLCAASHNQNIGIEVGNRCIVTSCTSVQNAIGIQTASYAVVNGCNAAENSLYGIEVLGDCQVMNNTVTSSSIGIYVISGRNRIDNNSVALGSGYGIKVDSPDNLIIRNSVRTGFGGTNYVIVANNKVGVIVAAPSSGAISGSTGGAGVGTTDPWANISY